MCNVLLPLGVNPIAVNKYIILLLLLLLYLAWKYGHTKDGIPASVYYYYKIVLIWDYLLLLITSRIEINSNILGFFLRIYKYSKAI